VGESSQIGGKEKNWSRIGGRREAAGTAVAQDGAVQSCASTIEPVTQVLDCPLRSSPVARGHDVTKTAPRIGKGRRPQPFPWGCVNAKCRIQTGVAKSQSSNLLRSRGQRFEVSLL
jgi:hypothetical protein